MKTFFGNYGISNVLSQITPLEKALEWVYISHSPLD